MNVAALLDENRRDKTAWRESGLAALEGLAFAPPPVLSVPPLPAAWSDSAARLVFLNGVYTPKASHFEEGLFRLGVTNAGIEVDIPASVCLATQPIELYFYNESGAGAYEASTSLAVRLAAGARATFSVRHAQSGDGAPFVHALSTSAQLDAGAKLVMGKWVAGDAQSYLFDRLEATLAADAFFDHVSFLAGGLLTQQTLDVALSGANATAHLSGAMLPGADERAATRTLVRHKGVKGESRQLYKTVLSANARGAFEGRILVEAGADGADATQAAHALLLSDRAQMRAQPVLEIYADDVTCSHGNTIGDLDAEALFYMQARGIAEPLARRLLIRAFLQNGIDDAAPALRAGLGEALAARLDALFQDKEEA